MTPDQFRARFRSDLGQILPSMFSAFVPKIAGTGEDFFLKLFLDMLPPSVIRNVDQSPGSEPEFAQLIKEARAAATRLEASKKNAPAART